MRDFNTLFSLHDKNGPPSNISSILQFRSVINELGLLDLPLLNRSFTWTNGRRRPTLERLDRAFISPGWLAQFPNSSWRALPRPRSDHYPLVLTAFSYLPSASLFRFESFWLNFSALPDILSTAWLPPATTSSSDPLHRFQTKISQVQHALKSWSTGLTTTLKSQSVLCLSWIDWLDIAEEIRILSGMERTLRPLLKERFEAIAALEEVRWRQRSRVLWLQAGDSNTKFFHRKANIRKSANHISSISDGRSILSSQVDIANHLFSFYSSQLGDSGSSQPSINLRVLYEDESASLSPLLQSFSLAEIKSAVFALSAEKAPGPYGLPLLFYHRFWGILKEDLLDVFTAFHEGSANLNDLNTSWIYPLPKKPVPLTAKDLRPISLVHSLSKIISKVLATRLQVFLPRLINPF